MKQIWIIGTELRPELGGPYKTTQMFRKALGAKILSLTKENTTEAAPGDLHYVNTLLNILPTASTIHQANKHTENAILLSSHMLFRFSQVYAYYRARARRIPYWVVPHGSMDPWVFTYGKFVKNLWFHIFGKRYLRNATHIIVATEKEKEKLGSRYSGSNVRVVHWPTERIDTTKQDETKLSFKHRLGIPPNDRILLYFGRYHSMKRPIETIRSFLKAKTRRTHLVLAGIDYDITAEQLKNLSKENPRIHVLNAVFGEDRTRLLLAADAYISLSIRENFNHTLVESMSTGAIPIISPGNDLGYSLPNECKRFQLASDEISEATRAITAFDEMENYEYARIGQIGKEWVISALSFPHFESQIQQLACEATGLRKEDLFKA